VFQSKPTLRTVAVWDLPVRLFHWSLASLMVAAWVTHKLDRMELHALAGYAVLTLVLFRLAWGLVGGGHARFTDFLRGPAATLAYARALFARRPPHLLGHNPLGGWMVLALLLVLLVQAGLGLFGTDDVAFDGPLNHLVGSRTAALFTTLHKLGSKLLLGMVALHLAGVAAHWMIERDNLVWPMFTGRKQLHTADITDGDAPQGSPVLAVAALAAAAGLVWMVVTRL
jgi:cytochrome b